MKDFKEKTAIVTGAASGIGLGIARNLARAGANIVLADIEEAPLARARAEIEALGAKAIAVRTDVSVAHWCALRWSEGSLHCAARLKSSRQMRCAST